MRHLLFMLQLLVVAMLWSASAFATPRFLIDGHQLEISGEEYEPIATIRHAGVLTKEKRTADSKLREQKYFITEPVEWDGDWYYGTGGWLNRLDAERGVILERILFPNAIDRLTVAADGIDVHTTLRREGGGPDFEPVYRYRRNAPEGTRVETKGSRPFSLESFVASSVMREDAFNLPSGNAERALLEDGVARDPTNPFYPFRLGEHYAALGDDERAQRYFDAARDQSDTHWYNQLQLAAMFDELRDYERADVVFDRAYAALAKDAPHFIESMSLVRLAATMGIWHQHVIPDAVKRNDFAAVDRMQSRIAAIGPNIEHGAQAWGRLAAWYAENDQPELAAKWAEIAQKAPAFDIQAAARLADRTLVFAVSCGFAAWLLVLLIGIRASGTRRWLRVPRRVDVIALVIVLVLPIPALIHSFRAVETIGVMAGSPMTVVHHEFGSPNAIAWLEARSPSDARDQLLRYATATRKAEEQGTAPPARPSDVGALLEETVAQDVRVRAAEAIERHQPTTKFGSLDHLKQMLVPWWLGLVVWFIVGIAIRNFMPRIARFAPLAIPGGARSAGILSGLAIAMTLTGLLTVAGIGSTLESMAAPTMERYFGLGALAVEHSVSRAWGWALLFAVLVFHVVTTAIDRRRDRNAGA